MIQRILLIGSLCLTCTGIARADKAPEALQIAAWNLEWFFDDFKGNNRSDVAKEQSSPSTEEWQWKLTTVAAAIAQFQPTILAVQEIEDRAVMNALTKALKDKHNLTYRVAFIEGYDSATEQDVAIIYQSGLVEYSRREQTQEMFTSKEYYNLSKHMFAKFEWQANGKTESLTALVLHLRATADAADLRRQQCKLAHAWMRNGIAAGENRVILGDLNVEEMAGSISANGDGMFDLLGRPEHPIEVIGTRHGEKLHETLLSREERAHGRDLEGYFQVPPDLRDLNYGKFVEQGETRITRSDDYTSHNTEQLDVEGMKALLLKLDFIRDLIAGRPAQPVD